ncbi:hypothetical protein [Micromonospora globbae]|uniref:Uncharacterized protein n=1 Tax=Micromonospora globbae TaxID=1894969 RepID=A0A420F3M1_9ACTN|nr:hypothetical protein [Micromonospora globbae]RKF27516.1 hypothetical protein D7I43_10745 [Micromonospora globbae]WTF86372.1 hypothetical protein OH732_01785 [Micromonospora globbae]
MRNPLRWLRRRTAEPPPPPAAPESTNLPGWMREPTRVIPTSRPGSPGRLTPAQQWRANGGRW